MIPTLGSPSNIKPNPFLNNTADLSGPTVLGCFSLSIPSPILEMSFTKADLELNTYQTDINLYSASDQSNPLTPVNVNINTSTMPSKTQMPTPFSLSTPKWDRQTKMLRNFLRIVEQLFRVAEITDNRQKLDWLLSYVEADIADQWLSFAEFEAGS